MSVSRSIYLERYATPNLGLFEQIPVERTLIVVIPCYKEPDILSALHALDACTYDTDKAAILVVVNEPEDATKEARNINKSTLTTLRQAQIKYPLVFTHSIFPTKKAGVGLARKTGMDEAVRYFHKHQRDGIIVCFDADCTCSPDFLSEIAGQFENKPYLNLGLVHFEHHLENLTTHIIDYELHLRYYINAQRHACCPHAVQTLGSCMTVRASAYQKQGGMNTRQAGEDFHFIHKMMNLGGIEEINTTTIRPSARISDRVPFGTGRALGKSVQQELRTYAPQTFEDLKQANRHLQEQYESALAPAELPESLTTFYEKQGFAQALCKMKSESNSFAVFHKKYYAWWDGLRLMKFVHHCRDHFYPDQSITVAVEWIFEILQLKYPADKRHQLITLREYDRCHPFQSKW